MSKLNPVYSSLYYGTFKYSQHILLLDWINFIAKARVTIVMYEKNGFNKAYQLPYKYHLNLEIITNGSVFLFVTQQLLCS